MSTRTEKKDNVWKAWHWNAAGKSPVGKQAKSSYQEGCGQADLPSLICNYKGIGFILHKGDCHWCEENAIGSIWMD